MFIFQVSYDLEHNRRNSNSVKIIFYQENDKMIKMIKG